MCRVTSRHIASYRDNSRLIAAISLLHNCLVKPAIRHSDSEVAVSRINKKLFAIFLAILSV